MNGGEPRLRGCIGTLEARRLISGFKDYALTRYLLVLTLFFFSASHIISLAKFMMCYSSVLPLKELRFFRV